jgi:hypothetical protein
MRVNHVRRDYYPMVSGSVGSQLTLTPGAAQQKAPWSINKIPTRNGKYFAYVPTIWIKLGVTIDQPASGGAILYDEQLAAILAGFELRRTKFGTPFGLSETSGQRLHNFDNRILSGYRHPSIPTPNIAAADGDTVRTLWIPISFNHGCNEKPHHFAPPAALLNGSLLDVYLAASTALADLGFSTGATFKSVTMDVIVEVLWEPEARLFVPVKHGLYEPQAAGATQRWNLDLGGRKGLDGVDDSAGSALMAMALVSSKAGLGGNLTVNEITRFGAQFLAIDSLDVPDIMSMEFLRSLQKQGDYSLDAWPFVKSAGATIAGAHTVDQLFFPVVMPPVRMELSKLSFIAGNQELTLGFSSSKAQATHRVFTQEAFPWDPAFILAARDLIFGDRGEASQYVPTQKFTRKQSDEDKAVMDDKKKRLLPWVFVPGAV